MPSWSKNATSSTSPTTASASTISLPPSSSMPWTLAAYSSSLPGSTTPPKSTSPATNASPSIRSPKTSAASNQFCPLFPNIIRAIFFPKNHPSSCIFRKFVVPLHPILRSSPPDVKWSLRHITSKTSRQNFMQYGVLCPLILVWIGGAVLRVWRLCFLSLLSMLFLKNYGQYYS